MRKDALFIGIEVDDAVAADPAVAAKLEEVCPVDIYARGEDGALAIVQDNIDECVLCRLCIDAAPAGSVKVLKLYDGAAAL
jgi:NAD-dependent dihydropyrimidine dehydrogenase PreA subunit